MRWIKHIWRYLTDKDYRLKTKLKNLKRRWKRRMGKYFKEWDNSGH